MITKRTKGAARNDLKLKPFHNKYQILWHKFTFYLINSIAHLLCNLIIGSKFSGKPVELVMRGKYTYFAYLFIILFLVNLFT